MPDTNIAKKHTGKGALAILLVYLKKAPLVFYSFLKLKALVTFSSMFLSLAVYSLVWGWAGAALFIALLFIHEMGHVLVNRKFGIPTSWPVFIPLMGAYITLKKYPRTVVEEAWSAFGGPALGTLGALASLAIWFATHNHLFLWGAGIGCFLNLFNLAPIAPLDGGRIVAAIWTPIWYAGLAAIVAGALWLDEPILLLLSILGLAEISSRIRPVAWYIWVAFGALIVTHALAIGLWIECIFGILPCMYAYNAFKARHAKVAVSNNSDYFTVPTVQRILFGALYLGLGGILIGTLWWIASLGVFV